MGCYRVPAGTKAFLFISEVCFWQCENIWQLEKQNRHVMMRFLFKGNALMSAESFCDVEAAF